MRKTTDVICLLLLLGACATTPAPTPPPADAPDLGTLWVRNAAEWEALALQAYNAATEDLPRLLADRSFSALPQQDATGLPPAVIIDVDETLVSNVEFQLSLVPPFTDSKFDEWLATNPSRPVPGAAAFVKRARDAGVTVFFVTNRACIPREGRSGRCPQEQITLDDLADAGIVADAAHLMLANEQPSWTQEKKARRDLIAERFRVIMLIGDDLGDFLSCVRSRILPPCTESATAAERRQWTEDHAEMWGNGWYVLPNPMHGSWTSAK